MKTRPILFSTPMVQALLEGRKTQTRRIVKPQPTNEQKPILIKLDNGDYGFSVKYGAPFHIKCPYGQPGDLLYVRETFCWKWIEEQRGYEGFYYYADGQEVFHVDGFHKSPWKPSIHMPRFASRITLEITNIRVERLQSISEEDAIAEGFESTAQECVIGGVSDYTGVYAREEFRELWESINGEDSWPANSWVWVIEFKVHKCNVDNFNQEQVA